MDDKEQAERDVQFQRRQGHRNSYTMQMEWGEWQICTEQDARRIDGLHSWQWRRIETVAASSSHREAEVKALREDAERYRWLCEQGASDRLFVASGRNGVWGECGHSDFGGFKDLIDKAIDAARADKE